MANLKSTSRNPIHNHPSVLQSFNVCMKFVHLYFYRPLFAGAAVFVCGILLTSCSDKSQDPAHVGVSGVPVVVDKVVRKSIPVSIKAIGSVDSIRTVSIRSLVAGTLVKVNFAEGAEVKKGDVLFEIDPRPFQITLTSASADLQKTQAQLDNADAQLARYTTLVHQGMVSTEDFQTNESAQRVLKAQVLSNQAAIANAKLQLEYCTIRSPCDGRTGALGAHEGDLVRANDVNISLVNIVQVSPIYVDFSVPQQYVASLQHYMSQGPVEADALRADNSGGQEKGAITFLDNNVDPTTGTVKMKATFSNSDRLLWPGQFVSVNVTLAVLPDQIVVPSTALQMGQDGQQVFVVRANKTVELRSVSVDRTIGLESVISKGLAEGETVVVDGQIRLRPDAAVEIKPAPADVPAIRTAPLVGVLGK